MQISGKRLLELLLCSSILINALTLMGSLYSVANVQQQFTFSNFELGQFNKPGIICPNTQGNCYNVNAEPQIRADKAGNFYASSEFLPRTVDCRSVLSIISPFCGGTGAWKSTDGGIHYETLQSPNSLSFANNSLSPYGGDTDLALAPRKNLYGLYNIYVVSLERATGPLLTVEVSTSMDGGKTWLINPTGATIPINDRPWVAADGSSKVCVSYHNIALIGDILVTCSYDAGLTFTQTASAIDTDHLFLAEFNNQIGNIVIDPNNHIIYQVFVGIASANDLLCDQTQDCLHAVWVAVSIDGGRSFRDYLVYSNPSLTVTYDHIFPSIAVDKAGNVYTVFSDNHNVYYSFSTNFGRSWSAPARVNSPPSNTAIMPWITAGSKGQIDIVWYGTSYYDGVSQPDNYPSSASWYVFLAQNKMALSANSAFTQVNATGVIHYGGVCEGGVSCTGNRDLFDDFGVAASPRTGLASIVYTSDQYTNTINEPPNPLCTPSRTNTGFCDHTNIATQLTGPGIFVKHKVEIERAELGSMNNAPEFVIELTNSENQQIVSLSVELNNLPLTLYWNSSLPLAPNATIRGSLSLLGTTFIPSIGSIYPLTVSATFQDGTVFTDSIFVIYTPIDID